MAGAITQIVQVKSLACSLANGVRSVPMTFELGRCDFQRKIHFLLLEGEATTTDTQYFGVLQINISIIIYWGPTLCQEQWITSRWIVPVLEKRNRKTPNYCANNYRSKPSGSTSPVLWILEKGVFHSALDTWNGFLGLQEWLGFQNMELGGKQILRFSRHVTNS